MESKELCTSDSDDHNDTTKDVDGTSSDKDEIPCCNIGTIYFLFDSYVV